MALRINTNVASLTGQKSLDISSISLSKSLEKLSSGLRINRAADDSAGLSLSEKMKAKIRGLNQSLRNANDGISLAQTAEGGLEEIGNILVRIKELATQSASGTITNAERLSIDSEFQALTSEITRISNVTEFNGQKLIDGSISASSSAINFQIGVDNTSDNRISLQLNDLDASAMQLGGGATVGHISTVAAAQSALVMADSAIATIASARGTIGSVQNRLESTIANLRVSVENFTAAKSRITDVDFATETAEFTKAQVLVQAGTSLLAQANASPQAALQLLR